MLGNEKQDLLPSDGVYLVISCDFAERSFKSVTLLIIKPNFGEKLLIIKWNGLLLVNTMDFINS